MLLPSLVLWSTLAPVEPHHAPATPQLEDALSTASPTQASAAELSEALALAESHAPEFARDPEARALLDQARLALASIKLALGELSSAGDVMDKAIRSAIGRELPAANFGPAVLGLYESRLAALEEAGRASIQIDCEHCEVIVNETPTDPELSLYLGRYRVRVEFDDPDRAPEYFEIELTEPGVVVRRSFTLAVTQQSTEHPSPSTSPPTRTVPRWASLSAISAGALLFVSGVVLSTIHTKCRGDAFGGDLTDFESCPVVYDNRPQDLALLGIGGSLMIAGGVVLSIDEVRVGRARGRQAMLTWTLRF